MVMFMYDSILTLNSGDIVMMACAVPSTQGAAPAHTMPFNLTIASGQTPNTETIYTHPCGIPCVWSVPTVDKV